MMQKDRLGQDMFLLGGPGVARRHLAMRYAELVNREIEFLAISRDTTEADLKQRREIVDGTAEYVDQGPVRAALEGRILIIEGLEKAERNVLPTLNNLLENREMALDDGRFLCSTERYDSLRETYSALELSSQRLCRVHPLFRVIALGLPVPKYPGHPLDPPLRSRFQARFIGPPSVPSQLEHFSRMFGGVPSPLLQRMCSFGETVRAVEHEDPNLGMLHLSHHTVSEVLRCLHSFPEERTLASIQRSYPYHIFGMQSGRHAGHSPMVSIVQNALVQFELNGDVKLPTVEAAAKEAPRSSPPRRDKKKAALPQKAPPPLATSAYVLDGIAFSTSLDANPIAKVTLRTEKGASRNVVVPAGRHGHALVTSSTTGASGDVTVHQHVGGSGLFVESRALARLVSAMMQDHAMQRHSCIVGAKGSGKSALVKHFGRLLGYDISTVNLYNDMTSRDLLQVL
jgi:MoxR-like ATPase